MNNFIARALYWIAGHLLVAADWLNERPYQRDYLPFDDTPIRPPFLPDVERTDR